MFSLSNTSRFFFGKLTFNKIRSSCPEVLLGKGVLKKCSKFTGEHPCQSAISIKLQSNLTEITLRYRCSPVNLLHIFLFLRTSQDDYLSNVGQMLFKCWCWSNATFVLLNYSRWSLMYKLYSVVQFFIVEHLSCQSIWKLGYFKGFHY